MLPGPTVTPLFHVKRGTPVGRGARASLCRAEGVLLPHPQAQLRPRSEVLVPRSWPSGNGVFWKRLHLLSADGTLGVTRSHCRQPPAPGAASRGAAEPRGQRLPTDRTAPATEPGAALTAGGAQAATVRPADKAPRRGRRDTRGRPAFRARGRADRRTGAPCSSLDARLRPRNTPDFKKPREASTFPNISLRVPAKP